MGPRLERDLVLKPGSDTALVEINAGLPRVDWRTICTGTLIQELGKWRVDDGINTGMGQ